MVRIRAVDELGSWELQSGVGCERFVLHGHVVVRRRQHERGWHMERASVVVHSSIEPAVFLDRWLHSRYVLWLCIVCVAVHAADPCVDVMLTVAVWCVCVCAPATAVVGHLSVAGGTEYDVCLNEANDLYGSYFYVYEDGSGVEGFQDSKCYTPVVAGGAPVCVGYWYESGAMGVFMNVASSATSVYDTWWAGLLSDVDYVLNVGNGDEHAVEVEDVTGVANGAQCGNYSSVYVACLLLVVCEHMQCMWMRCVATSQHVV